MRCQERMRQLTATITGERFGFGEGEIPSRTRSWGAEAIRGSQKLSGRPGGLSSLNPVAKPSFEKTKVFGHVFSFPAPEIHGERLEYMVSPIGTVPQYLLSVDRLEELKTWLNTFVLLPELRRYFLIGWAREVGIELRSADFADIGWPVVKSTGE